jgi:cyclophilin family peptidyl-prolyl cis-trans isomerase/outer membrane protein assembly factor BamB
MIRELVAALIVVAAAVQQRPEPLQATVVVFETDKGTIELAVDGVRAPVTAANFLKYVDGGFYDGGTVNRAVRPDNTVRRDVQIQVIQFQIDAARNGQAFAPIPLERTSVTGLTHVDGAISMARDGPDTARGSFSIAIGDQPEMDFGGRRQPDGQGFAAFGRVVRGMEVVRAIQASPTGPAGPYGAESLGPPIRIVRAYRRQAGARSAPAPAGHSDWLTFGYDSQRTGWNRAERTLSPASVGRLRREWKTVLPNTAHVLAGLAAPLVVTTADRELVIVGGSDDHVFALDAATGERVWQADFTSTAQPDAPADWLCPNALNATPVVDKAGSRVFAIASDGRLYTLGLGDGRVLMPAARFVPAFSKMWSLNYVAGVLYATTSQDCNGGRSGVWALDPDAPGRPVTVLYTAAACTRPFCGGGVWGRGGVSADADGHLYAATGDGAFDPAAGQWGTAVLKVQRRSLVIADWFVPTDRDEVNKLDLDLGTSTPVVFDWHGRRLAAVGGKGGVVYVMDTAALGGTDHRSAAWSSPLLSNDKRSFQNHGVWGSLGSWTDASGRVWLYVPTYGPTAAGQRARFPLTYGDDPNGSVQAFTVEADANGGPSLVPRWRSRDLKMPDPVAIANGVVFAYATGEDATQAAGVDRIEDVKFGPGGNLLDERERMRLVEGAHGTLFALDAATGRELWSSGTAISDWTHFSMPAVANGRVFVTTNRGHVYAFGLGTDRGERTYAPPAEAADAAAARPSPPAAARPEAPATAPADPTGAAAPPPARPVGDPATRALFAQHCASCHGSNGEGRASARTPDMRDPAWQQARTPAALEAAIRKGKEGGMPPFEHVLAPPQVQQLVAFIRALR